MADEEESATTNNDTVEESKTMRTPSKSNKSSAAKKSSSFVGAKSHGACTSDEDEVEGDIRFEMYSPEEESETKMLHQIRVPYAVHQTQEIV